MHLSSFWLDHSLLFSYYLHYIGLSILFIGVNFTKDFLFYINGTYLVLRNSLFNIIEVNLCPPLFFPLLIKFSKLNWQQHCGELDSNAMMTAALFEPVDLPQDVADNFISGIWFLSVSTCTTVWSCHQRQSSIVGSGALVPFSQQESGLNSSPYSTLKKSPLMITLFFTQ